MEWAPSLGRRYRPARRGPLREVNLTAENAEVSDMRREHSDHGGEWKPKLFPRESSRLELSGEVSRPVQLRARGECGDKENLSVPGNAVVNLRPRVSAAVGGLYQDGGGSAVPDVGKLRRASSEARPVGGVSRYDGLVGALSDSQLLCSNPAVSGGQRVYYRGSLTRGSAGGAPPLAVGEMKKRRKRRRSKRGKTDSRQPESGRPKRPCSGKEAPPVPEIYRVDDGDTSACDSAQASSGSAALGIAAVMNSLGEGTDVLPAGPPAFDSREAVGIGRLWAVSGLLPSSSSAGGRGFDPSRVKVDGECVAITRWDEEHGQVVGLSWKERSSYAHGRYPRGPLRGGTGILLSSAVYEGEEIELVLVDAKVDKFNVLMGL
ncbi:hypothetical protein FOZ63_017061, partial [Perkinsus olseni]